MTFFAFKPNVYIIFAAILLFLTLAVGSSLTHRPQIDEGLFASPAYNLATGGFLGTTVLEIENSPLTRINERTYWVQPLFLLNAAASFKIFGFSLFTLRLVSIFWGLVLLWSWFVIMHKLSANRGVAVLCLLLLACDYVILDNSASGRMDMMSASLGFAALAVYLGRREKNLLQAVLFSQILVVASGLTHPNGAMPFLGVLFTTVYLDWKNLGLRHFAVALLPYAIGGAAFGWWIWQDFAAWRAQFVDNVLMGGRMKGFESPLNGFVREFTSRYPQAFGLGRISGGHSGPVFLKSVILLGYLIGVGGVLLTRSLRENRQYRLLIYLAVIYFAFLALADGQKETPYLVHIVPFYLACLALWANWAWQNRPVPRAALAIGFCGFLALQTGGMALRIRQNTYARVYQPAVDYLKQNSNERDLIMGGAELGFDLRFTDKFVSDGRFAYQTGKRPRFIVFDDAAHNSWKESEVFAPELYLYIPILLSEEYRVVYENAAYKIYERR